MFLQKGIEDSHGRNVNWETGAESAHEHYRYGFCSYLFDKYGEHYLSLCVTVQLAACCANVLVRYFDDIYKAVIKAEKRYGVM